MGVNRGFQVVCCERGICSHDNSKTTALAKLSLRSVDPAVDEDPNRTVMNIGEVKILRIEG